MIKVINSSLKSVKKIVPNLYHDNRGKFYEGWNEKIYKELYYDKTTRHASV